MNDHGDDERTQRAFILPTVVAAIILPSLLGVACGGASSAECATKLQAYESAVIAAAKCDPTASMPCTAYGDLCGPVGVSPDSTTSLSTMLSDYKAAGCTIPYLGCPISAETPPPYTCTSASSGVNVCSSSCENLPAGGTCVSQSTGCANGVLEAFCAGPSMVCCSSQ